MSEKNPMRKALCVSAVVFAAALTPAFAGKGQGAIVIHAGAPVYARADGDKIEYTMKRGEAVAGYTGSIMSTDTYQFDEVKGRWHVLYFQEGKKFSRTAWMNPKDLARFSYDGSCQDRSSPLAVKGLSQRWNPCFVEARDAKLEQLQPEWDRETGKGDEKKDEPGTDK